MNLEKYLIPATESMVTNLRGNIGKYQVWLSIGYNQQDPSLIEYTQYNTKIQDYDFTLLISRFDMMEGPEQDDLKNHNSFRLIMNNSKKIISEFKKIINSKSLPIKLANFLWKNWDLSYSGMKKSELESKCIDLAKSIKIRSIYGQNHYDGTYDISTCFPLTNIDDDHDGKIVITLNKDGDIVGNYITAEG